MKIGKTVWYAETGWYGNPTVTVEWAVEGTNEMARLVFLFPREKEAWVGGLIEMAERAEFCRNLYHKHNQLISPMNDSTIH